MKNVSEILDKVFLFTATYLVLVVLLRFFIFPGMFDIQDLAIAIKTFMNVTAVLSLIALSMSAIAIPIIGLAHPHQKPRSSAFYSASILWSGTILTILLALYVKLMECPAEIKSTAWHCNVSGNSPIAFMAVILFISLLSALLLLSMRALRKK